MSYQSHNIYQKFSILQFIFKKKMFLQQQVSRLANSQNQAKSIIQQITLSNSSKNQNSQQCSGFNLKNFRVRAREVARSLFDQQLIQTRFFQYNPIVNLLDIQQTLTPDGKGTLQTKEELKNFLELEQTQQYGIRKLFSICFKVFFSNFMKFYEKVKDQKKEQISFKHMQNLLSINLVEFPSDEDALNHQKNIILTNSAIKKKQKIYWSDEEVRLFIWVIGKLQTEKKFEFTNIVLNSIFHYIYLLARRRMGICSFFNEQTNWNPVQIKMVENVKDIFATSSLDRGRRCSFEKTYKVQDSQIYILQRKFAEKNISHKWSAIASELALLEEKDLYRTSKQCRERWNNYLDPSNSKFYFEIIFRFRIQWQNEEDLNLLELIVENGKKWSMVSKKLNISRSENCVKNRFNCLYNRWKLNEFQEQNKVNEIDQELQMKEESSSINLLRNENKIIKQIIENLKLTNSSKQLNQINSKQSSKKKIKMEKLNHSVDKKISITAYQGINNNKENKSSLTEVKWQEFSKEELLNSFICVLNLEKNNY